jgi:hypothetical protein
MASTPPKLRTWEPALLKILIAAGRVPADIALIITKD